MKNLFTLSAIAAFLAAIAVLAVSCLGAQTEFTVDGALGATEVGPGPGQYRLLGTYTGVHSVTDRGLKALYIGNTATTLNIMVVASPEQTATTTDSNPYRALVLYLDAPHKTGVAAGTRLAGSKDATSQLRQRPTLDMPVDYGFRITVSPLEDDIDSVFFSKVDYTVPATATGNSETAAISKPKNGTVTIDAASPATKTAFATSATGSVSANATTGWELEIPLSALGGATTGDLFHVLAAYINDDASASFYSDVLPQITGQTTALGVDPNFSTIPGDQFYTYKITSPQR